jgi:ABC-type spermidine/putrescine transport system permease subunit II
MSQPQIIKPKPEDTALQFPLRKLNFYYLPALETYSILALLFLFLPAIMLVVLSFNSNTTGVFPLEGF